MKKRILSLLLTAAMLFSLLPAAAFAEDGQENEESAFEQTEIIEETAVPEEPEEAAEELNEADESLPLALDATVTSGICGDELVWTLDSEGVLTVSGEGEMEDYYYENIPWYDCRASIVTVVIESGVTSIGNSAFQSCESLTSVTISESVSRIGQLAFESCLSLTEIVFLGNAPTIGDDAFSDVTATVYIPENDDTWTDEARQSCGDSVKWPGSQDESIVASGTCGENLTWKLDSESLLTISGTGEMTSFSSADGYAAFASYRDSVYNVVIEPGVTGIGYSTFCYFRSMTGITIPEGVTNIGCRAFTGCSSLTSISIPNSVTNIDDGAFSSCSALTSVRLSDSLTSIGECVFENCSSLNDINIPSSLTRINDCTFIRCGLTSISIPGSIVSIYPYTFHGCASLKVITFEGNAPEICSGVFNNVTATAYYPANNDTWTDEVRQSYGGNITWVEVSDSGDDSGDDNIIASGTCGENLTWKLDSEGLLTISGTGSCSRGGNWPSEKVIKAVIQAGVTSIGDYAFSYCVNLTSIIIPEGVTSIGGCAFYHCDSLTSITIHESVTSIGDSAFSDCSSLTEINVASGNSSYSSLDGVLFNKAMTELLIYPAGRAEAVYSIPEGVTSIGRSAFSNCSGLTSVTIPDGVTSIGEYAFSGCSSLTSISIPEGVTSIGNVAFFYCSSLTSINIPETVTNIGSGAFAACTNLTSVSIPESVTSIGISAFSGCTNLTSISISEGVTSIGDDAFSGCSSLTEISVASENTSYSSDDGVLFNKSKTELNCYPAGKTETAYSIPESVTSIRSYAFSGCSRLTSITIPEGVTSIRWSAFSGCDAITDIYYGGSEEEWAAVNNYGGQCDAFNNAVVHYNSALQSHKWGEWTVVEEASCTETGSELRICSGCGETETREIAALGHSWDDGVVTQKPTDTATGIRTYTCTRCGETRTETIPVLSDNPGDANYDGEVNIKDVVLLMRHLAGDTAELNTDAADVNKDGKLNAKDIVLLMRSLAENERT